MKKFMWAALALLVLSGQAYAGKATVQEYSEDKAIADSLGTAADVLGVVKIPNDVVSVYIGVMADSATIYTVDVSLDGTEFATAFVDTCSAGSYDEHELGVPTSNATLRIPAYGVLPGYYMRVTADNLGIGTCYAKIIRRYEK